MCNYQDRENVDNECRSDRGVGRSFRGLSRDRIENFQRYAKHGIPLSSLV